MGNQNKNGFLQALKANLAGVISDAGHQKGLGNEIMAITNFCTVAPQAAVTLRKSKSPASGYHLVVCVVWRRQFPPMCIISTKGWLCCGFVSLPSEAACIDHCWREDNGLNGPMI